MACICVRNGIVAPSEFPHHVQPVCFGPDSWACVYIWVKVRSVSVALVGTLRHLLSFPLCQTLRDTHFLAGWQFPTGWPLWVGMWVMSPVQRSGSCQPCPSSSLLMILRRFLEYISEGCFCWCKFLNFPVIVQRIKMFLLPLLLLICLSNWRSYFIYFSYFDI